MIQQLTLPGRLQSFRRITSYSISLSSDRSATIFFKAVLFLELTQSLHLGRQQAAIFVAPIVVGRLADPRFATDLANRGAFLALPQDEGDLRLRKLRSLHGPSSSNGPNHPCR